LSAVDIVLPVYNEAEGIADFHASLAAACDALTEHTFLFRYVVDKCPDDSFGVLRGLAARDPRVRVLQLSRRFGHQASLMAGLDRCRGDAAIMMDCDGQHPPAMIAKLLEQFAQGFDVVHTLRADAADTGLLRKAAGACFYRLLDRLSDTEIREGAADFRLVSRRVLEVFQRDIREQNPFLRGLFSWVGFRQTTLSFQAANRLRGSSKYTLGRLLRFAIAGVQSFSKTPLTLAMRAGLAIAGLSFLVGLFSVLDYLFHTGISEQAGLPKGYTTLVLLVTFSLGVQLIVLGILGSYIGSILDEVKRRPLYVVEEEIGG
jgi:dolichol-phosphate mannosyltransferase